MAINVENEFDRAERLAKRLERYEHAADLEGTRLESTSSPSLDRASGVVAPTENTTPQSPRFKRLIKYFGVFIVIAAAIGMSMTMTTTPMLERLITPEVDITIPIPIEDRITPALLDADPTTRMTGEIKTPEPNAPGTPVGNAVLSGKPLPRAYAPLTVASWDLDLFTTKKSTDIISPGIDFSSTVRVNNAANVGIPMVTDMYVVNLGGGANTKFSNLTCSITTTGYIRTTSCSGRLDAPLKTGSYELRGELITSAQGVTSASSMSFAVTAN